MSERDEAIIRSILAEYTDPQLVKQVGIAARKRDRALLEALADEADGRGREDIAFIALKPLSTRTPLGYNRSGGADG